MLAKAVLVDLVQICDVGPTITVGIEVTRELTPVGDPIPGLVQTLKPMYALESIVPGLYGVKVARGTDMNPGQAVKVIRCNAEPALVGKVLLLDKVSFNGLSMIRKGNATDFVVVNAEGKDGLA